MFKKKSKVKKEIKHTIKSIGKIYLFSKYQSDDRWYFEGEFDSIPDAELEMVVTGEPESIVYKVIQGIELETEEGIATYPTNIVKKD